MRASRLAAVTRRLVVRTPAFANDYTTTSSRASESGHQLRRALLEATPEPIPGSQTGACLMTLPDGVDWPQEFVNSRQALFVRNFYADCARSAMAGLPPGKRFVVRGNSGSE